MRKLMKLPTLRRSLYVSVILILVAGCNPALSRAQDKPLPSKSIDLDKELAPRVPEDRAASYYHYALSKWNEDKGDFAKALSEMRNALKFNETSSALHLELANLLDKSGDRSEAIRESGSALAPGKPLFPLSGPGCLSFQAYAAKRRQRTGAASGPRAFG
jgi:tetratricopeptide (TPR) repeat protein